MNASAITVPLWAIVLVVVLGVLYAASFVLYVSLWLRHRKRERPAPSPTARVAPKHR